jgi:GNAT superfamily N-acetyltransferase
MAARPARISDARSIAEIEVETWRTTYAGMLADDFLIGMSMAQRRASWAAELRRSRAIWVWDEAPHQLLGFGFCGPQRGASAEYEGEIYMLYVLPDAQGRGIGRCLLEAMQKDLRSGGCRSVLVWVVRGNPARFFYERMGAKLVLQQQIQFGAEPVDVLGYGWKDAGQPPGSGRLATRKLNNRR